MDRIALSHGCFRIHQEAAPETGSDNSVANRSRRHSGGVAIARPGDRKDRISGCRGLSRVDLFLKEDGTVVLNEVDTLPGLTSYSRCPRMMAAAGLPLSEVIDRAVSRALEGRSR